MVYYFIFDVETTGLPLDYRVDYTDTDNWPRIVQISWSLKHHNDLEYPEGIKDYIIKPTDFEITEDTTAIHGISSEIANEKGVLFEDMLEQLIPDILKCDCIVAHNLHFDENVLLCELLRYGRTEVIESISRKQKLCTKLETIEFCKLRPYRYGNWKWPRLSELYFKLFGTPIDHTQAHNSKYDVEILNRCFYEIVSRGITDKCSIRRLRNRIVAL